MSERCPDSLIEFAGRLADAAGAVIRRYFRAPLDIERKQDKTPVTRADREAEAAMRELIEAHYPEHGIHGEEHGVLRADAEHVWVLDPIDGTKSFISGVPLFGTLVALLRDGKPILGIIDQPILGERWLGAAGRPTVFGATPVNSRPCADLAAAILFATSPRMFRGPDAKIFRRLRRKVAVTRHSADCYASGLLASGFIDLVVEASLAPYDYCALVPVIEGAGGVVSDWRGEPLGLESDGHLAAAGDRRLHELVLTILAG